MFAERVIVQLKEQTEMLSGQLQLADERYADLRLSVLLPETNIRCGKCRALIG